MTQNIDEDRANLQAVMLPLIRGLSGRIGKKHCDILIDFVENYEFPVALEWLHSVVQEQKITLIDNEYSTIIRLAEIMEIDLDAVK